MEDNKLKPRPIGRPPTDIDYRDLERLMELWPKIEWVAGFFRCSHDTISEVIRTKYDLTFTQFREMYGSATPLKAIGKMKELSERGSVKATEYLCDKFDPVVRKFDFKGRIDGDINLKSESTETLQKIFDALQPAAVNKS